MPDKKYTYSKSAAFDVSKIYIDTTKKWGRAQADRYDQGLLETVLLLSEQPNIGRKCESIKKDYQRHKYGRHIIFYRKRKTGIFIIRVLHERMDYKNHLK